MKGKSKILNKVLGLTMATTMVLSGMSVPSFAAGSEIAHKKSISGSGDSYTLTLDVTGKDKTSSTSTTTKTNGHADIVMVLDVTSSMSTAMSDGTTRLAAIQNAANSFVSGLNTDTDSQITLITFGMTSNSGNTPIWTNQDWTPITDSTKTDLKNIIDTLTLHNDNYSYDTTYAPGLNAANDQLNSNSVQNDGNNKYVIFFSDGDASDSQSTIDTAANAVKQKATVFSIGLPPTYWYQSADKIESVASGSDKYFEASNASEMLDAFHSALEIIKEETTVSATPMTNVVISDTLSENVEQDGDISVKDSGGKDVTFTDQSNGKTIAVKINEVPDGETYTVSIPVKPSDKAREKANAAETDSVKLPSNDGATLTYSYGDDTETVDYAEKPEIEVAKQTFTVTWQNEDGTVLETDENVAYGTTPSYDGEEPEKAGDAEHSYEFSGWNPEIAPVTEDVTYTAQYAETTNAFTVTWQNEDGTVLETDENVAYGATPSYDGEEPTKAEDDENTYVFDTWTPAVEAVTGNVVYTATFTATPKQTTEDAKTIEITKILDVSEASRVPDETFAFTVTSSDEGAPEITGASIDVASSDEAKDDKVTKTTMITLPTADQFTKEGTYTYTIAETKGSTDGMTYDDTQYTLKIYVEKTNTNQFVIHSAFVYDSTGANKKDDVIFNNAFSEDVQTTTLKITKEIAGNHADMSKKFDYTITFTKPTFAKNEKPTTGEDTIAYGEEYSFQLGNGDEIAFTVPVNTTYTVTEAGTENYIPAVVTTDDGTADAQQTADKGEALTVADKTITNNATAAFTNTYDDENTNPLTGIVEKNGPFLMLGVLAILGVGLYLFDRRRKAARE